MSTDIFRVGKYTVRIDPVLRDLLPPPSDEEQHRLEESIKGRGIRDPLILWCPQGQEYILLDGHTRVSIARRLGLELDKDTPIQVEYVEDHQDAQRWIIK